MIWHKLSQWHQTKRKQPFPGLPLFILFSQPQQESHAFESSALLCLVVLDTICQEALITCPAQASR